MREAPNSITPATLPTGGAVEVCLDVAQGRSQALQCPATHSPSHQPPPGLVCPARAATDRQKIITTAATINFSFLITESFHSEVLARRIIALAEVAHSLRQSDTLESLGQQLRSIARYESIGAYYRGLAAIRRAGEIGRAQELFERASEHAPPRLRARAILSLGVVEGYRGDVDSERRHYAKALGVSDADHWTRIEAARAVAVLDSFEGDHRRAVALLESLYPVARQFKHVNPRLYFDLLNSLAVEYKECGQLEAAREVFKPVLRSALINRIDEFRETAREIREAEARPIVVAVPAPQPEKLQAPSSAFCGELNSSTRVHHLPVNSERSPIRAATAPASLVQSRVMGSAPIHGPPFTSE